MAFFGLAVSVSCTGKVHFSLVADFTGEACFGLAVGCTAWNQRLELLVRVGLGFVSHT